MKKFLLIIWAIFLLIMPCESWASSTRFPIVSNDGNAMVQNIRGNLRPIAVQWEEKDWRGYDYMYDLLQHAPTSYYYRLIPSRFSPEIKADLFFSFPDFSRASQMRWRLYQRTSEKVGWLIVTKNFRITPTGQSHTVVLDRVREFILVSDSSLLNTSHFKSSIPVTVATITEPTVSDRPAETHVTITAAQIRRGSAVVAGKVGDGNLEIIVHNPTAKEPLNIFIDREFSEIGKTVFRWRWDGVIPSSAWWRWRSDTPSAGWFVQRGEEGEWKPSQVTRMSERDVMGSIDSSIGLVGIEAISGEWNYGRNYLAMKSPEAIAITYRTQENQELGVWSVICNPFSTVSTIYTPPANDFALWALKSENIVKTIDTELQPISWTCPNTGEIVIRPVLEQGWLGSASWYPARLSRRAPQGLGAAMNVVPQGSWVTATDLQSQKKVTVQIVSAGPYADGRIIDFTSTAFRKLAPLSRGILTRVIVRPATHEEIKKVRGG